MKKKNSHLPEFLLGLVGVVLIGTALYHILSDLSSTVNIK